jgi:hypothetical protein
VIFFNFQLFLAEIEEVQRLCIDASNDDDWEEDEPPTKTIRTGKGKALDKGKAPTKTSTKTHRELVCGHCELQHNLIREETEKGDPQFENP